MEPRSGITTAEAPEPTVRAAEDGSPPVGASAATILLLATWIGLIAGFLDLGLMVVNRRLIDGDFYRLGDAFRLDHPGGGRRPGARAGDGARADRPVARRGRPAGDRPWGCSPSSDSSTCARRLPLESVGVAPAVRWARRPVGPAGRSPPPGVPPAGAPNDPAARRGPAGDHAGDDRRSCLVGASGDGRLAAAARRRPERAADRLGHGPRRESEPPRLRPTDDAQPGATGRPRGAVRPGVRDVLLDPAVARQPVHRAVAP